MNTTEIYEKIFNTKGATSVTLRVYQKMRHSGLCSVRRLVNCLGTSKPPTLKAIATLEKLGLIEETTGYERHRLWRVKR